MEKRIFGGIMIKQLHDELEKQANNTLRPQDLTLAQVRVLMELSATAEKQMSLKELERRLHVAQSTAAGIIIRLEQKGFVNSFGSNDDRRIKMVRLTPTGEQCCKNADQDMIEIEERLLSALTESERDVLFALLQKICQSLK